MENEEKRLKILEVLDCYYPKFDGPCLVVASYARCLNELGASAKVAVPHFPDYVDNAPFEILRINSIPSADGYRCAVPETDKKLKEFLRENDFDLIHIHSPFTLCRFFTRYGKKHGIPTVFTFHTKYKEDFERTLKSKLAQKFMMRYILKNMNLADYCWTVSDGAIETMREYGYKKPVKVIRNGTDLTYPENADEVKGMLNGKYDIPDDCAVFLSVGRIVENKKLQLAMNALCEVKKRGYKFRYLVVGSGEFEPALKILVEDLGLTQEVIFTGKVMDRTLLSAHYLNADLFLFPSTFDTASLSPIEAAAMKLPTLMTRGCSTAEIITDGVNGYLADESSDAWADAIVDIIKDKTKLAAVRENAYAQVYRSWKSVAEEVLENYKLIVKK